MTRIIVHLKPPGVEYATVRGRECVRETWKNGPRTYLMKRDDGLGRFVRIPENAARLRREIDLEIERKAKA